MADYEGELQVLKSGSLKYSFRKIADQMKAGTRARKARKKNPVFGKTIFSSDPEELSLEESELEDFDKKLKK